MWLWQYINEIWYAAAAFYRREFEYQKQNSHVGILNIRLNRLPYLTRRWFLSKYTTQPQRFASTLFMIRRKQEEYEGYLINSKQRKHIYCNLIKYQEAFMFPQRPLYLFSKKQVYPIKNPCNFLMIWNVIGKYICSASHSLLAN